MLEALPRPVCAGRTGCDQAVAVQQMGDRARCRHVGVAFVAQRPMEFASAPTRVLAAQGEYGGGHGLARTCWRGLGAARAIRQGFADRLTMQPLVGRLAADAESARQLGHAYTMAMGQGDKLATLGHRFGFLPRHGTAPPAGQNTRRGVTHVLAHLLPMSPVYTVCKSDMACEKRHNRIQLAATQEPASVTRRCWQCKLHF
jgi:hypothetical protein